jgi:hypothetical protein
MRALPDDSASRFANYVLAAVVAIPALMVFKL